MSELDEFDDNDPRLMTAAVGKVRRVHAEAQPEKPRPKASPRQFREDERQALQASRASDALRFLPGEVSEYRRPEVPSRTLKRLRRGLYAVQDEIDLHGLRAADAETLLRQFLREATQAELGCVRIIHGKGLRAPADEPVLRPLTERLLTQRADVLAFCSAPAAQGGTGAVLVLLARRRSGVELNAALPDDRLRGAD